MNNRKKLSPIDANSNNKVCSLNRDNLSTKDYWIIADDISISLYKQKNG